VLALALSLGVWTTVDAWRCVGKPYPGFSVMDNLLVGLGVERGVLEPFDFVRAMDGRILASGQEIHDEVRRHPPGTTFRYLVNRRGRLVEADITSKVEPARDFARFLLEGLLPGLLFLGLGAAVLVLKPDAPDVRVFLLFCVIWSVTAALYRDAVSTYRFDAVFLTAWAFSPALYLHLAQSFPEPRPWALRHPRAIWLAYGASAGLALLIQMGHAGVSPSAVVLIPIVSAVYWVSSLVVLIVALAMTAYGGSSALARQRARVLLAGFALGQLAPVLGTTIEAVTGMTVPYLNLLWKLDFLFPVAVAYAMVRYDLFDVRAVVSPRHHLRAGDQRRDRGLRGCHHAPQCDLHAARDGGKPVRHRRGAGARGRPVSQPSLRPCPTDGGPPLLPPASRRPALARAAGRDHDHGAGPRSHRRSHQPDGGRILSPVAADPGLARRGTGALPRCRRQRRAHGRGRPHCHHDSSLARHPGQGAPAPHARPAPGRPGPKAPAATAACPRWGPRRRAGHARALRRPCHGLARPRREAVGRSYTTDDLRLLRVLVNQSAVALENARARTPRSKTPTGGSAIRFAASRSSSPSGRACRSSCRAGSRS
jgi:hypothetical protein